MTQEQAGVLKGHLEKSICRFRDRLQEFLGSPVQVILFGSYARGEASEGSDVDLLVVVATLDKGTLDSILEAAWEVGFAAGMVFSVIPVAAEELDKLAESPFLQAVEREGIRL